MANLELVRSYTIDNTQTSAWNLGTTSDKLFTTAYSKFLITLKMDGSTTNSETIQTINNSLQASLFNEKQIVKMTAIAKITLNLMPWNNFIFIILKY